MINRKNIKFFISIFLFILSCHSAKAQPSSTLRIYNTESGLVQNSVLNITMDKDGFLWIGTYSGLTRFNGTELTNPPLDNSHKTYHLSNDVLSQSDYKQTGKTFVKVKEGSVYEIEDGKPVLYKKMNDSVFFHEDFVGQYPSFELFKKFNASKEGSEIKKIWSNDKKQVLPVNSTDFIVTVKQSNKLFYYKNGVKEFEIGLEVPIFQFLKSGKDIFFLDSNYNILIYDSAKRKAEKIFCYINQKKITRLNDFVFLWDTFNNEAYCFFDNTFYSIHYNASKNIAEFIPEFSSEAEDYLWTCILHDKINDIYFIGTMNEGLCVFKKKWIKVYRSTLVGSAKKNYLSAIYQSALKADDSKVVFT